MMRNKVLVVDTIHPVFNQLLLQEGINCTDGTMLTKEEVLTCIDGYDGIEIRSRFLIDKDFIDACDNLKFIARAGAGMENIDLISATAKGILCMNAPEGNRDAVGEHALGMLLMLLFLFSSRD